MLERKSDPGPVPIRSLMPVKSVGWLKSQRKAPNV